MPDPNTPPGRGTGPSSSKLSPRTLPSIAATTLRRGTVQGFVLQVAGTGLLFGMHAAIARTAGASGYGVLTFGLAVGTLVASLAPLGWPTATMRYGATYLELEERPLLRGLVIRSHQAVTLLSLVGALGLLAASGFAPSSVRPGLFLAAACTPFLAIDNLRSKLLQALRHLPASLVPRNVVLPVTALGFLAVVVFVAHAPVSLVPWSYAVGLLAAYVVARQWLKSVVGKAAADAQPRFRTRMWASVAFPMALGGFGQMVMNRQGQVLVGSVLGARAVGLYGAADRLASLTVFFLGAVNLIAAPLLASAYHAGRRAEARAIVRTAILWSALATVPLVAPLLLFPGFFLGVFGPGFAHAATVLRVLVAGQLVNALTGPAGFALNLTGHERLFAILHLTAAAVSVIGTALLIPRAGIVGAAIATACTISVLNATMLLLALGPRGVLWDAPAKP